MLSHGLLFKKEKRKKKKKKAFSQLRFKILDLRD